MKVLKVLGLVIVLIAVTGCGTLHLNHIIAGVECHSRDDCIKAIGLNNQPEKSDITFVVEPLLMYEKEKAPIGTPAYNSPFYHGNVELCVSKALRKEFQNARITFDKKSADLPFILIKLNKIVAQAVLFPIGGMYMRIDYDLTINDKTYTLYAKTNKETFWSSNTYASKHYPLVCAILARQVREVLEGKPISELTNEVEYVK